MSQAGKFATSSGPVVPSIVTLTGNSGGAVGPDGIGNIDVVGDSTTINVVGSPGTNTLTISADDSVATSYATDSGSAIPVANVLNIVGDSYAIVTSAAANTVTISFNPLLTSVNATPYVVTNIDFFLSIDASFLPITVLMPNTTTTGRIFIVKDWKGQANLNNIIITTPGGVALFDGVTAYTLNTQYQSINLIFDGTNYQIW